MKRDLNYVKCTKILKLNIKFTKNNLELKYLISIYLFFFRFGDKEKPRENWIGFY
jgi:hypothetical protein